MKNMKVMRTLAVGLAVALTSGCYTTKVYSGKAPEGPQHEARQWFLINGLAPLSPPAGQECQNGVSTAETSAGAVDILISVGLAAAGGAIGALACGSGQQDPLTGATAGTACALTGSSLLPWLFGTRTVTYTCAAGAKSAALQPAELSTEQLLSEMLKPQPAARTVAAPVEQAPATTP
jgi:hypothetical protein